MKTNPKGWWKEGEDEHYRERRRGRCEAMSTFKSGEWKLPLGTCWQGYDQECLGQYEKTPLGWKQKCLGLDGGSYDRANNVFCSALLRVRGYWCVGRMVGGLGVWRAYLLGASCFPSSQDAYDPFESCWWFRIRTNILGWIQNFFECLSLVHPSWNTGWGADWRRKRMT